MNHKEQGNKLFEGDTISESYSQPIMGGGHEFPLHETQCTGGVVKNELQVRGQREHLRAVVDMGR